MADAPAKYHKQPDQGIDPVTRAWLWAIVLSAVICLGALALATGVAMGTLTG